MKHFGSGAKIEIREDKLFKYYNTTNTSLYNQYHWLYKMSEINPDLFPKIYSWKVNGYEMEYLKDYENLNSYNSKNNKLFDKLIDIINIIKKEHIQDFIDFDTFIFRIQNHLKDNNEILNYSIFHNTITYEKFNESKFIEILKSEKEFFNNEYSNCHGDLTLENIFIKNNNIKLIDPNFMFNVWNSWLLDIGKLCQSIHYDYENMFYIKYNFYFKYSINKNIIKSTLTTHFNNSGYYKYIKYKFKDYYKQILLLEICNYIRMMKYKLKISKEDYIKSYLVLTFLWNDYLKEIDNVN